MSNRELCRRYAVFAGALLICALGIALITKAGLGTSPLTSPAYVLTFLFPFSLGTFSFLVNCLFLLAQIAMLRSEFCKLQLLQLPATFVFSAFIDLFILLMGWLQPAFYPLRLLILFAGCICLGLGVALQVTANVIILPGEGIVKVIAAKTGREFGMIKTLFDGSHVAVAVVISLIGLGNVAGVREGTIIAACIVGAISRFFRPRVAWLVPACDAPPATSPDGCPAMNGDLKTCNL